MNKILGLLLAGSLALNIYYLGGGSSQKTQASVAEAQPGSQQSLTQDSTDPAILENITVNETEALPAEKKPKKKAPSFSKMMENPMMKSEMQRQIRAQLSLQYSEILADLGFAGDESEALIDIVVEREQEIGKVAMKAMRADSTERPTLSAEAKALRESYDDTLRNLVGDEAHAELERFDETEGERKLIDSLSNQLAATSEPITPTQEQQLMDLMWEVRQDPNFGGSIEGNLRELSLGIEFPTNPTALLTGIDGLQKEVLARASFLTPTQAEALQENQDGFIDLMRFQIGMGGHGE